MKMIILSSLTIWLLTLSVLNFFMYRTDKLRAKNGSWRIKESVLLGVGILGGALGGLLGMKIFRHKTKHWYFWLFNSAAFLLHVAALLAVALLVP